MKNNYLHTGNTTKKSSARAKPLFRTFGVVAAVTLAGVALAAGPEHRSVRSSKSQVVAENPDASNNHGVAMSGKNPIAEKYNTLVMRVYFRDRAERDRLAQELNAEEVPTTGGYLTVIRDRDLYYGLTARGLHVEIDENSSRNLSHPKSCPSLSTAATSRWKKYTRSSTRRWHSSPIWSRRSISATPGAKPIQARASYPVPGTATTCLYYTSRTATYQAPNRSSGRTAIYTPARSLRQKSSCA